MKVLGIELSEWFCVDDDTRYPYWARYDKQRLDLDRTDILVCVDKSGTDSYEISFCRDFCELNEVFKNCYDDIIEPNTEWCYIHETLDKVKTLVDSFLMRMENLSTFT